MVYDDLLDKRENPGDLKPSLDLVDAVTYWTWRAKDIPRIPGGRRTGERRGEWSWHAHFLSLRGESSTFTSPVAYWSPPRMW